MPRLESPQRPAKRFNPRPPLLAGECCFTAAVWAWSYCFNPRPPLLAGEWRNDAPSYSLTSVSIHARHCWRANGPNSGRSEARRAVSIHARHCWRANASFRMISTIHLRFQSTPAIAGGRMARPGWALPLPPCFNPRPPLLAGECWASPCPSTRVIEFQSTPAIAGGRMNSRLSMKNQATLFQSTPAIAGGRMDVGGFAVGGVEAVSIHARHCWRANANCDGDATDVD